jgi:ribonuclease HI
LSLIFFKEPKKSIASRASTEPKWAAPPSGVVCVIVDAALFSEDQRMGWGAVLRDHNGAFILCARERLNCFPDPEMAEALAARRAMMVAKDHGIRKVLLVSDCLSLIHHIKSRVKDRSALDTVIGDIKTLATDYESCSFSFSSRKTNVVAHTLARCAESLVCNISVGVVPELIRKELYNNVI